MAEETPETPEILRNITFEDRIYRVQQCETPVVQGFVETAKGIERILGIEIGQDVHLKIGGNRRLTPINQIGQVTYWRVVPGSEQ